MSSMSCDVTEESRYSDDKITNEFGDSLFSLYIALEPMILNGCLDAKRSGKCTFVPHAGSSVTDYWTVSLFLVNESVLSPHMCLKLSLSCCIIEYYLGR